MKKKTALNLALILLIAASVCIAATPNAVAYFYPDGEGVVDALPVYGPFFALNEDVSTGICLPAAGLASCVAFLLAVAYAVSKKPYWLKGVAAVSFAAMFLATLPFMVGTEIKVLPNVGHPIAAGVACLIAYGMLKQKNPEPDQSGAGPRLDRH